MARLGIEPWISDSTESDALSTVLHGPGYWIKETNGKCAMGSAFSVYDIPTFEQPYHIHYVQLAHLVKENSFLRLKVTSSTIILLEN